MDDAQTLAADERTALLFHADNNGHPRSRASINVADTEPLSISSSTLSEDEQNLGEITSGELLPYNSYTTVDWPSDLAKDSSRLRKLRVRRGIRYKLMNKLEATSGWVAAALIGTLTACVAFLVDVAVATVSDWKQGYCRTNPFVSRETCCKDKNPMTIRGAIQTGQGLVDGCEEWVLWSNSYWKAFAIYVGFALAYGLVSASATTLTKRRLPAVSDDADEIFNGSHKEKAAVGKLMSMASGSGIPEIKTILSGFEIPHFLDLKVLVVKAFGAVFAVPTGMCLGKEGPFVHISTCVGYLVGKQFPKYKQNGRKMRELLSVACASGLSVAFGAPIGGVLFSYEEISTHFPRKVLWRAFLCSLFAAMVLRELNPTGTGKLVLFETNFHVSYRPTHYLVFIFLGFAGGLFGGVFCKANFRWSKWFRAFPAIKDHPVFEVFLVVLATALLQFPNPLTREPGDIVIRNLLIDCRNSNTAETFVCRSEKGLEDKKLYAGWLVYGTLVKLFLTTITFGCKVPSGVIIPALDGGAFFGRLVGQAITDIPQGVLAMVGAGAFLAGVSRMTVSFAVIMLELTGELEYVVPNMIAIMVAKWTADGIFPQGVYDLAQTVAGHPFLDYEIAVNMVQSQKTPLLVEELIPAKQTMDQITVHVPQSNKVPRKVLETKLAQLRHRGLMDGGLMLIRGSKKLEGYIPQSELDFGLKQIGAMHEADVQIRLLDDLEYTTERQSTNLELDLSMYVDRTIQVISSKAPLENAIEMFGKLGLGYLCVVEEGNGRPLGIVIKKRLLSLLQTLER